METIRKAILLEALVWIEGDAPAPQDFARLTKRALRAMLREGARRHPELRVTLRRVRERSADEE